SPLQFAALSALVFCAGVVDALAGGGGLITLPAYLSVGVDPALVLGTNKLASSIGTTASTATYMRKQRIAPGELAAPVCAALFGAFAGARLAQSLDPSWLRWIMVVLLPVAAVLVLAHGKFAAVDRSAQIAPDQRIRRAAAFSFPLGIYDGF